MMRFQPSLSAALIAVLLFGCASTPIRVRSLDAHEVHRRLTANVLTTGELSAPTRLMLDRLALGKAFRRRPAATMEEVRFELLEQELQPHLVLRALLSMAELSYYHAERGGSRDYYLAAAVYAWAFLFPERPELRHAPLDPGLRLAADLYNRGVAEALESPDGSEVLLEPGTYPLPFGELHLEIDPEQFRWGKQEFFRFISAAEIDVVGIRNRLRVPGIGAPLVAQSRRRSGTRETSSRLFESGTYAPVTVLIVFEDALSHIEDGTFNAHLELHAASETQRVEIAGVELPLEYQTTAALAYGLSKSDIWKYERAGFFSGNVRERGDALTAISPYRPGRVPVVLVHGTASSPARWADLFNELYGETWIRERFQFWFFSYNTGNPISYSAGLLDEALRNALEVLDPDGEDDALRKMVVIGHSQGGLLAKMTSIDSGNLFWSGISSTSFDEIPLSPASREILERSLFFEPLAFVRTLVFIATPFQGSFVAGGRIGQLISGMIEMPNNLLSMAKELTEVTPELEAMGEMMRLPNSIENMDPDDPFLEMLDSLPVAPWVRTHTIIAVRGSGPIEEANDGVVTFESARYADAESEFVIRSGHSVQSNPRAVAEVRRILVEHLHNNPVEEPAPL